MCGAAADANFSDDSENDVLRSDAFGPFAMNKNVQRLGFALYQALRREHVLDFAGSNAESQSAERAVRRSVAVAANNRLPGLRNAQLRANDMHDALILAVHVEQANAGFAAIVFQRVELGFGILIDNRQKTVFSRNRMIHHRESKIRAANFAALPAQAGKRLRRGAFVNQMPVNIQQGRFALLFIHQVAIPDLLVKGSCGHRVYQPKF